MYFPKIIWLTLLLVSDIGLVFGQTKEKSKVSSNKQGIITSRPHHSVHNNEAQTGLIRMHLSTPRENLLYVTETYSPEKPAALAIMLHGAGGEPKNALNMLKSVTDSLNLIIFAPSSYFGTWDIIGDGAFGADIETIDLALQQIFQTYQIDSTRVIVAGFSDGASYALTLGLINGNLLTHIVSFSPGFIPDGITSSGSIKVFISHGSHDPVLPITACGEKISKSLKKSGYTVTFVKFEGKHEVPQEIRTAAINWLNAN